MQTLHNPLNSLDLSTKECEKLKGQAIFSAYQLQRLYLWTPGGWTHMEILQLPHIYQCRIAPLKCSAPFNRNIGWTTLTTAWLLNRWMKSLSFFLHPQETTDLDQDRSCSHKLINKSTTYELKNHWETAHCLCPLHSSWMMNTNKKWVMRRWHRQLMGSVSSILANTGSFFGRVRARKETCRRFYST